MNDPWLDLLRPAFGLLSRAAWVAPLGAVAACGGGSPPAAASPTTAQGAPSEVIEHEPCKESGHRVEAMDTNGDGKADIRRVFDKSSGQEICRIVDLNRDGKPDLYEYFDAGGTIRRREFCYDDTGDVNAVEHYEKGKLVSREFDAAGRHRIDTWDTFDPSLPLDPKTGRPPHPIRRERDTSGDGKVDQWWTWSGDRVTIADDRTGDGRPDPEATVVLGLDNTPMTPSGADRGQEPVPAAAPAAPAVDAGAVGARADGGRS